MSQQNWNASDYINHADADATEMRHGKIALNLRRVDYQPFGAEVINDFFPSRINPIITGSLLEKNGWGTNYVKLLFSATKPECSELIESKCRRGANLVITQ